MSILVSAAGAQPAAAPASNGSATHIVQHGDTLSAIASRHGVSLSALLAANPQIGNPDLIYVGQQIALPGDAGGAVQSSQAPAAAPATASDNGGGVTAEQLQWIVPSMSAAKAAEVVPHLNYAMAEANINTPIRQAMFIAQLAHESAGFHYMEEIASGEAYEGRLDLGNTEPGDGVRYKGRGYIQLTGRYNYRAAGQALGLDLEGNPWLAAQPENAARVAAWYWNSRNINAAADSGDFVQVTRLINGGTNGLADRQAYYDRARAALGSGGGAPPPPGPGGVYTVRSGDTLGGIAERHGTTVSALLAANPSITNPDLIYVGQQITLPGGGDGGGSAPPPSSGVYTVRSGDTLGGIAERHGTTVSALLAANPSITNPDLIYVGQQITLPGSGGASSSSGGGGSYTVRSGDTLSGIAARHRTTVSALLAANPSISNPNLIYVGQRIQLP